MRSFHGAIVFVSILLGVTSFTSLAAGQTTWHVDDDACPAIGSGTVGDPFCSIQDGIDAAFDGDTVLVAPGTYFERLRLHGKAITVRSSGGPSETIIDGDRLGTVVTFRDGETLDTVFEGFTIQRGSGTEDPRPRFPSAVYGGGVICYRASPTIRGNIIRFNDFAFGDGGGGIAGFQSDALIENNRIGPNGGSIISGVGIWWKSGSPRIIGNDISDNEGFDEICGVGGGLFLWGNGSPTVMRNRIANNRARAQGGGIYASTETGWLVGNVIHGNRTGADCGPTRGGGVYARDWVIEGNLVFENSCNSFEGASGGGIYGGSLLVNNIVHHNGAFSDGAGGFGGGIATFGDVIHCTIVANGTGGAAGGLGVSGGTGIVANSIIRGNNAPVNPNLSTGGGDPTYSNIEGGSGGTGNIDAPALFDSRYHLRLGSPCIDAADGTLPDLPSTDFDGDDRVLDGDGDLDALPDMGADELRREVAALHGTVAADGDATEDVLFVNESIGDAERTVAVEGGETIVVDIANTDGGNGRFVLHLNVGKPSESTIVELPFALGPIGFPFFLASGATPSAVWNNVGKTQLVGESAYFGMPQAPPAFAPTTVLDLPSGDAVNLPPGTTVTIQGVIVDPASASPKGGSVTNGVVIELLP